MYIVEMSSQKNHPVEIKPVEDSDYENLPESHYFFDWSLEREHEVYKLQIVGTDNILGLISLERVPTELRVHIRLLTVSVENRGQSKQYDRIAGNLIAYAAQIAVREYADMACISLRPKTELEQHYINKYNMVKTGITVSTMVPEILDLIESYE